MKTAEAQLNYLTTLQRAQIKAASRLVTLTDELIASFDPDDIDSNVHTGYICNIDRIGCKTEQIDSKINQITELSEEIARLTKSNETAKESEQYVRKFKQKNTLFKRWFEWHTAVTQTTASSPQFTAPSSFPTVSKTHPAEKQDYTANHLKQVSNAQSVANTNDSHLNQPATVKVEANEDKDSNNNSSDSSGSSDASESSSDSSPASDSDEESACTANDGNSNPAPTSTHVTTTVTVTVPAPVPEDANVTLSLNAETTSSDLPPIMAAPISASTTAVESSMTEPSPVPKQPEALKPAPATKETRTTRSKMHKPASRPPQPAPSPRHVQSATPATQGVCTTPSKIPKPVSLPPKPPEEEEKSPATRTPPLHTTPTNGTTSHPPMPHHRLPPAHAGMPTPPPLVPALPISSLLRAPPWWGGFFDLNCDNKTRA